MLTERERTERREKAKRRLSALREKGYQFICTYDDGATWVAAHEPGLEIEPLLSVDFVGNVETERSAEVDFG